MARFTLSRVTPTMEARRSWVRGTSMLGEGALNLARSPAHGDDNPPGQVRIRCHCYAQRREWDGADRTRDESPGLWKGHQVRMREAGVRAHSWLAEDSSPTEDRDGRPSARWSGRRQRHRSALDDPEVRGSFPFSEKDLTGFQVAEAPVGARP